MPTITCEFTTTTDNIVLTTKTNGDRITITGIHLTTENAGNLAKLVNGTADLKVEIKEV
jgi:hypothetical protein